MATAESDDEWDLDPEYLKELSEKYKGEDFPLFRDELPADWESNPHYAAIHALLYDEQTPEERVDGFRAQGNEIYCGALKIRDPVLRRKAYGDAVKCYTHALQECTDDTSADVRSVLYANRAMARLSLGDYVDCVDDARRAIKLNSTNAKAHYRAAKASYMMQLWRQSVKFCTDGLKAVGDNSQLTELLQRSQQELDRYIARRKKQEQADSESSLLTLRRRAVEEAQRNRGIKSVDPQGYDLSPLRVLERLYYDREEDLLHWPCLVLYPEANVSEYILDAAEDTPLRAHFEVMLPVEGPYAPWDVDRKYVASAIDVFLEAGLTGGALVEVDLDAPLRSVLSAVGQVATIPILHVLPSYTSVAAHFRAEHKIISSQSQLRG